MMKRFLWPVLIVSCLLIVWRSVKRQTDVSTLDRPTGQADGTVPWHAQGHAATRPLEASLGSKSYQGFSFVNGKLRSDSIASNRNGHVVLFVDETEVVENLIVGFEVSYLWDTKTQELTRIPLLEGFTALEPRDISDDGMVVGYAGKVLGFQAFQWDPENGTRGLGMLPGHRSSYAYATNGRRIVGHSSGGGQTLPVLWTLSAEGIWEIESLPSPGEQGSAQAISDNGKYLAGTESGKPALWVEKEEGWMLVPIAADHNGTALAINSQGIVAGEFQILEKDLRTRTSAFVWKDNKSTLLGVLDSEQDFNSHVSSIDEEGTIFGFCDTFRQGQPRCFVWTAESAMHELKITGSPYHQSSKIRGDHLVGITCDNVSDDYHAFVLFEK